MHRLRRIAPKALAVLFTASGITHFMKPETFTGIVPRLLPVSPEFAVYASGAAELVLAVGLLRDRRWAGVASAVFLVALLSAHVQMLLDFHRRYGPLSVPTAIAWVRLPLQLVLILAALQSGKRPSEAQGPPRPPKAEPA